MSTEFKRLDMKDAEVYYCEAFFPEDKIWYDLIDTPRINLTYRCIK